MYESFHGSFPTFRKLEAPVSIYSSNSLSTYVLGTALEAGDIAVSPAMQIVWWLSPLTPTPKRVFLKKLSPGPLLLLNLASTLHWCPVAQSCLTLCDLMDCSPPGSSVHGILQTRILKGGCHSFSSRSSRTWVSHITGRCFTLWASREALKKLRWSRSIVSDSLWLHGLEPTRLFWSWDFPGNSIAVGCHFLLHPSEMGMANHFSIPPLEPHEQNEKAKR